MTTPDKPTRVCFTLQVRPELIEDYRRVHMPVRREMLREIVASGRRNYTLFLGETGLLVGYYETDDDVSAQKYLAESSVAALWEREMAPYFQNLTGRPDQASASLTEVFHLEEQIHDLEQ